MNSFPVGKLSTGPALVIGAAGVDMVGTLDEATYPGTSNPAKIRISFGGVARNIAENLARLGQPVSLVTVVGKDHLGDELLDQTQSCGVEISACQQVTGQSTASYLAIYNEHGKLELALEDMRVLKNLTAAHLKENEDLFKEASIIFIDANLSSAAMKMVFQLARRNGVRVCADATSPGLASRLVPFLGKIHLLTANRAEASILSNHNPDVTDQASGLEVARQLINQKAEVAIITLADNGVCYATSDVNGHVPAILTKVLDPTGAGDALTSAVIFGLMNDIPIDDAVRLGVSAASLVLRHPGTVLPDLSLERLYDQLVI
jgi:pseudouridine kinase